MFENHSTDKINDSCQLKSNLWLESCLDIIWWLSSTHFQLNYVWLKYDLDLVLLWLGFDLTWVFITCAHLDNMWSGIFFYFSMYQWTSALNKIRLTDRNQPDSAIQNQVQSDWIWIKTLADQTLSQSGHLQRQGL